ncbi:MAG: AraC family transcriptional regulator, partial [Sphaerochaeta sp.]|nr:AraC family transcriptional regulator [Sphaerochaeta sp.]
APGPVMERESTRLFFCEDEQVAKAMQLIKAEATGGLQASEVARQATICRRSLEMRFRSVRGTTIWEEITTEKLSRATLLLTHSKESITTIAQQCGFSSIHRFYSLFKRKHHMTPQQYREKKLSD